MIQSEASRASMGQGQKQIDARLVNGSGRALACKDNRHQSYFCCSGQCVMHIANLTRQQHKINLQGIESEQTYLCNIFILSCFLTAEIKINDFAS